MNVFHEQMIVYLNDTSFEDKINHELQLNDIIYSALANDQEPTDTTDNTNDDNDNKNVSSFDMSFLFQYINSDKDKNDFKRIINDSNALTIQTPCDKLTNISELFPELSIKTEQLPIYEEQQQLPIEYIDLYENNDFDGILNEDFQHSLIFNNTYQHKSTDETFLNVKVNNSLTKMQSEVKCFTLKGNILLIGFDNGVIELVYYDKGIKKRDFKNETVNRSNDRKQVICIDLYSNDLDYFVAGYMNGMIIVWEINTGKPKAILREDDLTSSIVNIKCLNKSKKDFSFLASDSNGTVQYYLITQGFFSTKQHVKEIKNTNKVFFLIETFGFYENNYTISDRCVNNINQIQSFLFVLGNVESIEVFLFNYDEIKSITIISKQSNEIPDVCFGFGRFNFEKTKHKLKNINFNNEHPLFVVGWNTELMLFIIHIKPDGTYVLIKIATVLLDVPVKRIGFLESSMLYVIDKHERIIVLNTLSINEMGNQKIKKCVYDPRKEYQLKEPISFTLVDVEEHDYKDIPLCYQYVVVHEGTLLIHCKGSFIEGKVYKWNEYLKVLEHKQEWEMLFHTGLDIIEGKVMCLKDIPLHKQKRFMLVKKHILDAIEAYINVSIEKNKQPETFVIKMIIEVLININEIDFLLGKAKMLIIYKNNELLEMIYNELEPYILNDKLLTQYKYYKEHYNTTTNNTTNNITLEHAQTPFGLMIKDYINMHNEYKLSKLLPHYPIEYINKEETINYCKQYNFTTALIIIHNQLDNNNLLLPFIQLFKAFNEAENRFIFDSLDKRNDAKNIHINSLRDNKKMSDEEFEKSKEYLGHKLLWYINIVLNKQTFPNKQIAFDKHKHSQLIPELFLWYISNEVLINFVQFDSFNYFQTLLIFFSDTYIEQISTIKQQFFNNIKDKYNKYFLNEYVNTNCELNEPNLLCVVKYIQQNCIHFSHKQIFIKQDLYEFIIKLPKVILFKLEYNLLYETVNNLLQFHSRMLDGSNNTFDKFKCHYKLIFKVPECLTELSNEYINPVIDLLFNKPNSNSNSNYNNNERNINLNNLIIQSEKSPYTNTQVFLLQIKKEYKNAVKTLINNQIKNPSININDEFYIFNYVDKLLQHAKLNEEDEVLEIKNHILDSLPSLAEISISDVSELIEKWFNDKEKEAVDKFNALPHLQYEFVEKEIEKFTRKLDMVGTSYQNQLHELLIKQIELLIKLDQKHIILGKIMERPDHYCILDECLNLCRDNDVTDACIFLYIKRGLFKQALLMKIKEIRNLLERIKKNILYLKFDYSDHQIYLINFEEYIRECINICELGSSKCSKSEKDELWFDLFDEICIMINQLSFHVHSSKHLEDLRSQLIIYLQDFLKQMSRYINIEYIIQRLFTNFEENNTIIGINKLIGQLLQTFYNFKKILSSVKQVAKNSIANHIRMYKLSDVQGVFFKLKSCDACGKKITSRNPKGTFYSFNCGHVTHPYCILLLKHKRRKANEITCPICRKIEINFECYDNKDNEEEIYMEDNVDEEELEEITHKQRMEHIETQEKKKKRQLVRKLTNIDKGINERLAMFYNDDDDFIIY